jgi:hypothetical protein
MTSGCWIWTAALNDGYGVFWTGERNTYAHRFAYEQLVGEIPTGLQIDHLCRNRSCVNPEHMEPVTGRVNILRGYTFAAQQASRTHCPEGHAFTEENTYRRGNHRECLKCRRRRAREAYWRTKEAV